MKRMNRKLFAALLACALCGALAPAGAWADVKIDAKNFPDANFRRWVKENAAGGKNVLTDAQRAAVKEMDLSETGGISSLKGLEHFTALEALDCEGNKLMALDLSKNKNLSTVYLEKTGTVVLPNGDRIDMADFQLRRTAAGKFQLDLSRYAGKIEKVWVRSSGVVDEDVPVTSSRGVYTFDPCIGYGGIIYKLGRREGEDWTLELLLDSITPENIDSVPLVEAKAKADPNATEDIIEDAGGKPKAQAKTGYVLRGGKAYRVDGGKERLLANVEPHGVRTEAGLWAWIMIDPETDGMEGSESGVQFFLGEDAKPAGFLPVEDVEVCAVRFSSLGDKLLTVVGTGARQDVGLYLVDAANGGFVKKRSFASMGPVACTAAPLLS